MANNRAEQRALDQRKDARKFERTRIPLSAKITDLKGCVLTDCTIRDLSLVGAQIVLPTSNPIPKQLYLVELANAIGYQANVAWWRPGVAGLAFQAVYELEADLPLHVTFLRQVLIGAKLEQVEALTAEGASLTDAVRQAGLSGSLYARWKSEKVHDRQLAERLWELEAENALLRKLLTEAGGDDLLPRS